MSRFPELESAAKAQLDGPFDACRGVVKSGAWMATRTMAAVSSISGGLDNCPYTFENQEDKLRALIGDIRDDLDDRSAPVAPDNWNVMEVIWTEADGVRVSISYDHALIPRKPDDARIVRATTTRMTLWQSLGARVEGPLGPDYELNKHGAGPWFGPHKRLFRIQGEGVDYLVTDGLSTPWVGITDPENGSGCEIYLRLAPGTEVTDDLIEVLLMVGDLIVDGYRVPETVQEFGAIYISELGKDDPLGAGVVLSHGLDPQAPAVLITGLPYGDVPFLCASLVSTADLADLDIDEGFAPEAARTALNRAFGW